jgi:hypothetical protein
VFYRHDDNVMEAFVARSGVLQITHASASRVEGTFTFEAVRYCLRSTAGESRREGSCSPTRVDPDAPVVSVTGSFVAKPATYTGSTT